MSKIYEALRQAEQESAKNAATAPASAPAPAAEVAVPAADATGLNSPAGPQTVFGSQHAPVYSRSEAPVAAAPPVPITAATTPIAYAPVAAVPVAPPPIDAPLDLANIPQVAWAPSLHQLPALERRGAAVEQFRSLRSRMQEFRDLNTLKSILVSSGVPQEGKSFIAANLAISFARHKAARVLLIDGDMRRSSLHKLLGAPQGPGLTEYLAGRASITGIMQRARPDEQGRPLSHGLASLIFIPGGNSGDKAADLSGNRRFDRLITEAAPNFDWIVVDSSPVNLVSDGVNLARACDGVLMVARGGSTKYEVAQRALAELKASKVLGFVLNAVQNPPVDGGYYGYDGYDSMEE
jgi:capsular exopolysaccharide synthesis family protein